MLWSEGEDLRLGLEKGRVFRIRRVFHFRDRAQRFEIAPPLDERCVAKVVSLAGLSHADALDGVAPGTVAHHPVR